MPTTQRTNVTRSGNLAATALGALAVGIAQGALDASVPYAQTREQFGRPIGTFQGVAFMVADMATEIEAARGLVWRAAWLKDQGRDFSLVAAQAKLFAANAAWDAADAHPQPWELGELSWWLHLAGERRPARTPRGGARRT